MIGAADTALQRVLRGRPAQSQLLLGLRGVGKTVLLNRIEQIAQDHGYATSFIEAPEDRTLAALLYPKLHQILRKLSLVEAAKARAHTAMRALRSFAGAFKIAMGDLELSVDPEPGVADSGDLEYDLTELFLSVGEAARAGERGWALLIDEVQYLSERELAALITALHRASQKSLPIIFFSAGLPQLAALSGDAKSYAERLFVFPRIDALDAEAAAAAIREPIESEGEAILDDVLAATVSATQGYPYFLQEWGYQLWNAAEASPIAQDALKTAAQAAQARLDDGFFKVRFERLTPKEREYALAMARLGVGPYRASEVAAALGESPASLGPRRAKIIAKGMIYSPGYGDIAFTVPLFEDYLARRWM